MTTLRPIQLPEDQHAVLQLDTSFTTDRIYRIQATPASFTLLEEVVQPPLHKSFALDGELDNDRMWDYGIVAEDRDALVGFGAVRLESWNRRAAIWPLYVAPGQRGTGVGKRVLGAIEDVQI